MQNFIFKLWHSRRHRCVETMSPLQGKEQHFAKLQPAMRGFFMQFRAKTTLISTNRTLSISIFRTPSLCYSSWAEGEHGGLFFQRGKLLEGCLGAVCLSPGQMKATSPCSTLGGRSGGMRSPPSQQPRRDGLELLSGRLHSSRYQRPDVITSMPSTARDGCRAPNGPVTPGGHSFATSPGTAPWKLCFYPVGSSWDCSIRVDPKRAINMKSSSKPEFSQPRLCMVEINYSVCSLVAA